MTLKTEDAALISGFILCFFIDLLYFGLFDEIFDRFYPLKKCLIGLFMYYKVLAKKLYNTAARHTVKP